MNAALRWGDVEDRIARDDLSKRDHWVSGPDLSVEEGALTFHKNRIDFTERALSQMCGRTGVPAKYASVIRKRNRGLFDQVMTDGIRHIDGNQRHLIRIRQYGDSPATGSARACLSGAYATFNNSDYIEVIESLFQGDLRDRHQIRSFHLDDSGMWMKILFDDLRTWDPVHRSKELKVGVVIGNSEVGMRNIVVRPFIYRAACTNDAQIQDANVLEQRHVHLDHRELRRRVSHSISRTIETSESYLKSMVDSAAVKVESPLATLERVLKKAKMEKSIITSCKAAYLTEPHRSKFGVVQAMTAAAQSLDAEKRVALEVVAGQYLRAA